MITDTVHSPPTTLTHHDIIAAQVGSRLRTLREQRQMSLADVERLSGGDVGPSTIGAYERGVRAISLPRLNRLAELYGVPLEHLLPTANAERQATRPSPITERLTIDTIRLGQLDGDAFRSVLRFIELIRVQRVDPERSVITLRGADTIVISAMLGIDVDDVVPKFIELGLLATAPE